MKNKLFLLALSSVFVSVSSSCSDEALTDSVESQRTPIAESELSGEELDKYAYGCEYYAEDTIGKIETEAKPAYFAFAETLMNESLAAVNKSLSVDEPMVGVVKMATCGKYDEVEIFFDAEDRRPKCYKTGYASGCSWDAKHNVWMRFCVVPASLFKGIGKDYAVLLFTDEIKGPLVYQNGSYSNQRVLRVHLDAEDNKTESGIKITKYDGTSRVGTNSDIIPNSYDSRKNLNLFFQHFPASWKGNSLPNLGFEYAVFGTLYGSGERVCGSIYFDTEDKNTANSFTLLQLKRKGNNGFDSFTDDTKSGQDWKGRGVYEGLMEVGGNAAFYISKAPQK